mmetsp:Transcript_40339/g.38815  ORF Transcript_40339/g.38815 Transcript_40339/m.38815 type:complete len:208 (+) Transcript_40339:290-913(+)
MYSWQMVGALSMYVERFLQNKGYEYLDRQPFFFIRGAYPFYIMSSFFLMSYFYFLTDDTFVQSWNLLYLSTFLLKFLLSFVLVFKKPAFIEKQESVEKYIRECRMDLQRFRCPQENQFVVLRCFHCVHCRKCTLRYEKHSYLVNRCISANNIGLYHMFVTTELFNTSIVMWAILVTFEQRIDADLVFFIFYLACVIGHEGLYIKKFW